jgi:hypothetical protein
MALEKMRLSNINTCHSYFVRVVANMILDFSSFLDMFVHMLD